MNQILVSEKVYVTPTLRRKKRFYKIQFVLSIIIVLALISYWGYTEYQQRKYAAIGESLIDDEVVAVSDSGDNTIATEDTLFISLSDESEQVLPNQADINEQQNQTTANAPVLDKFNTTYNAPSGAEYKVDSILNIPSLEIRYPVLSNSSDELLKISLNKFWGGEPNTEGNYCIVGHNYDGKDIFFGKLYKIQNGDIVELTDKTGATLKYKVYNKFIVEPTDVACTSQLTNGKTEMTLITCSQGGKTRLVVKCREI